MRTAVDDAEPAGLEEAGEVLVGRVESLVERRGVGHAGPLAGRDHGAGIGQGSGHGLLAQHGDPRRRGRLDEWAVRVVGGGDVDGVDRGEEGSRVAIRGCAGEQAGGAGQGNRRKVV